MSSPILLSITIYAMAVVISFMVAAVIKGIVMALPLMNRTEARDTPKTSVPAEAEIPPAHIAAISAALAAVTGPRHIIHIEDRGRTAAWTSEGRMIHQTSHAVPRSPKR
jgi:hypothetical protein